MECSDWIEAQGAQRRDIAGGERDSGKYKGDASEGGQIGTRHAVEQSGHEVRDDERTGHTQPGASGGQTESPAQDHLEKIASLSSQREANGDLTSLQKDATQSLSWQSSKISCPLKNAYPRELAVWNQVGSQRLSSGFSAEAFRRHPLHTMAFVFEDCVLGGVMIAISHYVHHLFEAEICSAN